MTTEEPLTSDTAVHIFNTFKVSVKLANDHAEGIKGLISAKGGEPDKFSSSELKELVTKQLKDKYEWKNSTSKKEWEDKQRRKADSYNQFISSKRSKVFK